MQNLLLLYWNMQILPQARPAASLTFFRLIASHKQMSIVLLGCFTMGASISKVKSWERLNLTLCICRRVLSLRDSTKWHYLLHFFRRSGEKKSVKLNLGEKKHWLPTLINRTRLYDLHEQYIKNGKIIEYITNKPNIELLYIDRNVTKSVVKLKIHQLRSYPQSL